ncbi:MAG TPA: aldo/keto reductase [Steroidobacteraceae bacterium]|jgi:aryl-alcohol dehydrogenase-like predicted oxidoreductase
MTPPRFNRRDALLAALTVATGVVMSRTVLAASAGATVTKAIPSSGQKIPAIGIGTNNYNVTDADDLAARKAVLDKLPALGGAVVDTAPLYGQAEAVIGDLVAGLHNRDRLFLATKVMTPDAKAGEASMEESLRRLKTQHIDLMQVHNLIGVEAMIPVLQAWKKAGRIGYYGITTSSPREHARMMDYMRRLPMDFIQVDYSLANRSADQEVLPLAAQKGIAVIANSPFGGRRAAASVFGQVAGKPLPDWAADIQVTSWSQLFLKFVISHPAVTCTVPGTTLVSHLDDNMAAAHGALPDQQMRQKMTLLWDNLKS